VSSGGEQGQVVKNGASQRTMMVSTLAENRDHNNHAN
jgi:hypothetical protein